MHDTMGEFVLSKNKKLSDIIYDLHAEAVSSFYCLSLSFVWLVML